MTRPVPSAFPEEVVQRFAAEYQWGMIGVEEGSSRESEFLEVAAQHDLIAHLSKTKLLLCDQKGLASHPFYFLYTKQDKEYRITPFFNYDQFCYSDATIVCRVGVEQDKKIVLDPKKSKYDLDVMSSSYWPYPLMISRRLKSVLEEQGITGYETVACLQKGEEYPDEYFSFNARDSELDGQANYYQLVVTSKVKSNPRVSAVDVTRQCPRCKTVYDFFTDVKESSEGYFCHADFNESDMQYYDGFISKNRGEFGGGQKLVDELNCDVW